MPNIDRRVIDELRDRTRLSGLVESEGVPLRRANIGEFVGLCPFHGEKTPSFRVYDDQGHFHCFGCGAHGDAIQFLMDRRNIGFTDALDLLAGYRITAPAADHGPHRPRRDEGRARSKLERAWDIWKDGRPIAGTAVEAYLTDRRKIDLAALDGPPGGIRCAVVPYWRPPIKEIGEEKPVHVFTGPAMVAAMCDADRRFAGVHVTWLRDDGSDKVGIVGPDDKVLPARKIYGESWGATIRLARAGPTLSVGEGIETSLSAMAANGVPAHCAVSLGNLAGRGIGGGGVLDDGRKLPSPEPDMAEPGYLPVRGVQRLVIIADHDGDPRFGVKQIRRAWRRFTNMGIDTVVAWPPEGYDLNDLLQVEGGAVWDELRAIIEGKVTP